MRSLRLDPASISAADLPQVIMESGGVPHVMSEVGRAFDALRPALSGLRSFVMEPVWTLFAAGHFGTMALVPRGGLSYALDMPALRSFELIVDDCVRIAYADLAPLPASLRQLVLGVRMPGPLVQTLMVEHIRGMTPTELTSRFHASAQSLVRLDLAIHSSLQHDPFAPGLVGAFLHQHTRLEHLTLRAARLTALLPAHVAVAAHLRTLRLYEADPSVATMDALGCVGVRELVIERSAEVAVCPWPAIVGSASLPALALVRVEWHGHEDVVAPSEAWTDAQRLALVRACQGRRIDLVAFWDDN